MVRTLVAQEACYSWPGVRLLRPVKRARHWPDGSGGTGLLRCV